MTTGSAVPDVAARHPFLESRESFLTFVSTWEAGALSKAEWTHAAHVAVGACYVVRYGAGAIDELRRGIKRHNAAVGTLDTITTGYHESLTRLWTGVISRLVTDTTDPWLAAAHAVERVGGDGDLHRLYYSFDVVRDPLARRSWVEPDLHGPY